MKKLTLFFLIIFISLLIPSSLSDFGYDDLTVPRIERPDEEIQSGTTETLESGAMWNWSSTGWIFPIALADVYYNLTNLTAVYLNGFNFTDETQVNGGSYLTLNGSSGLFDIDFGISFSGGNTKTYDVALLHNFNIERRCSLKRTGSAGVGDMSHPCHLNLTTGDTLSLGIENEDTTQDVTIYSVSLTVKKIGGVSSVISASGEDNCNSTGSCSGGGVAYIDYSNIGDFNISNDLSVDGTVGNTTDRFTWAELNTTGTGDPNCNSTGSCSDGNVAYMNYPNNGDFNVTDGNFSINIGLTSIYTKGTYDDGGTVFPVLSFIADKGGTPQEGKGMIDSDLWLADLEKSATGRLQIYNIDHSDFGTLLWVGAGSKEFSIQTENNDIYIRPAQNLGDVVINATSVNSSAPIRAPAFYDDGILLVDTNTNCSSAYDCSEMVYGGNTSWITDNQITYDYSDWQLLNRSLYTDLENFTNTPGYVTNETSNFTTDTNETTRFNTLVGTDCGAGDFMDGVDADGTPSCDTPAGGSGWSDYEIITNTSAASSAAKAMTVRCSNGKNVTGGGCHIDDLSGELQILQTNPLATKDGWNCYGIEDGNYAPTWVLTAYVMCAVVS